MANSDHRSGRQCPKGHSMDPNWVNCPYCEAEEKSKQRSLRKDPQPSSAGRKTRVGVPPVAAAGRETKVMAPGMAQGPAGAPGSDPRRIMGVLISYTWNPSGDLFAVREGKNFIGSEKVSSDASHQDCDIQVPFDTKMSAEHALILCRHGQYEIIDQASTNGTFLNETLLPANQSNALSNYATIKTGDTLWTFVKIEAPEGAPAPRAPDKPAPKAPEEPPEGGTMIR